MFYWNIFHYQNNLVKNVHRMKEIPNLVELNIGHSIISRAIFVGIETAVREMKELVC